ncbi:DUF4129 domain-containing transglutaminase family protein [Geobacillus sp. YF-1]|uniref:DUF4129 domain-containing transglutaminase family protein n=1 Tax=Geobacillus sp. YF-1 TaxID=3457480 RepID=UPI00404593EA
MKKGVARLFSSFLPALFAAWLLTEWLWPLDDVTDTGHIGLFVSFVFLCFAGYWVRLPAWLAFLGKGVYIGWALSRLSSSHSIAALPSALWRDCLNWLWGDRSSMPSDTVRTFVFFLLLWLASAAFHWLIGKRQQWLIPYALTVTYIAVLDTFFPYNGDQAIVRLVGLGFFAFVWLHGERMRANGALFSIGRWRTAALFVPALALAAGYAGPKLPPQWPDPVAFIRSAHAVPEPGDDEPASSTVAKVGYGQNDSRLGGPFLADDTLVFTAKDRGLHYWRVETKDVYTGKGWEEFQSEQVYSFANGETIKHEWWSPRVETVEQTAEIHLHQGGFHLVYPLGLRQVRAATPVVYRMKLATEKIETTDDQANAVPMKQYVVTYGEPDFPIAALRAAPPVQDRSLLKRYTQLPKTLPQRVRDLAKQITAGEKTAYDQVKAIEQYFQQSGYVYETKNVAVPGENEDYVDQFLFETKQGYCDNFSTSMVVLVRTLGIPARWVKGYVSGRLVGEQNGDFLYEVRNNDAHSWVEVYFEGVGWVPFEPTRGFVNPYAFSLDASEGNDLAAPEQQPEEQDRTNLPQPPSEPSSAAKQDGHWWERLVDFWSWKTGLVAAAALVAAAGAIYATRRKWWPRLTLLRFQRRKVDGSDWLISAYAALLRHLHDYGLKRRPQETLRQYAKEVDRLFETDEMNRLTRLYECVVYGTGLPDRDVREAVQLWENLIKRTIS